jgi:hypothetical protein
MATAAGHFERASSQGHAGALGESVHSILYYYIISPLIRPQPCSTLYSAVLSFTVLY